MKSLLIAALVVIAPSAAVAQGLPRYDPEKYCKSVSEFGGSSNMIYNSCIEMEQNAYDLLKQKWVSVPAKTQAYCDEVAGFGGASYSVLQSCIEMETDAGSSTKEFKF